MPKYVCVWMGCNKNSCFCIDVIGKSQIDNIVLKLGGDPKEELCQKLFNCSDEEHDKIVGTFMEPQYPGTTASAGWCSSVNYKIYKITPYKFDGKIDGCSCDETVYFIKKGKYSVQEIVGWVQAVQI